MSNGHEGSAGLTVLAVDDEKGAMSMLVEVLDAEPRISTVLQATNASEALAALRREARLPGGPLPERVDVVFLDIRMPGLDGLELAKVLGMIPNPPAVVFVTAHDDKAVDAFDIGAADYLMKPVGRERLANTIRRIMQSRREAGDPAEEPGGEDEVIPVELAGTTRLVPRSSVRWVEAQGDYARLHTCEGSHLVRIPLSQLEDRWSDAGFVRIHRSFLVALPLVTELRMSASGYVVRVGSGEDAAELPVSRRHTRELKDRLVRAAKQGWTSR
ncbi:MAG TPA: LytTR family DNA-binding domain-containing protein [Pseudonocardiaceae bacterium]|jgi:DNA-binding LytR/AlgR family response regulator|nr:LytTR family DNA-binding domain-containing protein [Pseudonocardiaceae bacterium]